MRLLPITLTFLAVLCFGCASAPVQAKSSATVISTGRVKMPSRSVQSGQASYYADRYHGKSTASGEPYDKNALTAAHRKLPFGTRIKVTNKANGKSVVVRVNDRGPFVKGRVVDLSRAAFSSIGNTAAGVITVTVEVID